MDYKDIELGATEDFFWFKAKIELIDILLRKVTLVRNSCSLTIEDEAFVPPSHKNDVSYQKKYAVFSNGVNTINKMKILDIGCGIGSELEVMKSYGDVYIIDVEPKTIASIPDSLCVEKKVCNVCDGIPYQDSYFDIVVAFDLLEHLQDDVFVIGEIHRILKKKGFLVFTVPAFQFLFSGHDWLLGHFRRYNKNLLKDRLRQFKCMEVGFWACSLFLPVIFEKLLRYNKSNQTIKFRTFNKFFNNLFYNILRFENYLIRYKVPLPFGTTIYGIYQNTKDIKNTS